MKFKKKSSPLKLLGQSQPNWLKIEQFWPFLVMAAILDTGRH
jgi:hypothetical protein